MLGLVAIRNAGQIPLGIHGDDAGVYSGEKITAVTVNAACVDNPNLDNRILFGILQHSRMVPEETIREFWNVLVWSFKALAEGKYLPTQNLSTTLYSALVAKMMLSGVTMHFRCQFDPNMTPTWPSLGPPEGQSDLYFTILF